MTEPVLKYTISRSLYEASVTRKGHPCLIVSYYATSGDVFKEWLFPGKSLHSWWKARSKMDVPSNLESVADLASKGAVLPTKSINVRREGRWPKVVDTTVGQFPESFARFMAEVKEVFGDVEVVKVIA